MTDGLLIAGFIAGFFAISWLIMSRKWRRAESVLLDKRRNLSEQEFVAALANDTDTDVAK